MAARTEKGAPLYREPSPEYLYAPPRCRVPPGAANALGAGSSRSPGKPWPGGVSTRAKYSSSYRYLWATLPIRGKYGVPADPRLVALFIDAPALSHPLVLASWLGFICQHSSVPIFSLESPLSFCSALPLPLLCLLINLHPTSTPSSSPSRISHSPAPINHARIPLAGRTIAAASPSP